MSTKTKLLRKKKQQLNGSTMFDLWSNDFQKDAINLTPWKVLQCFLSGFSQIYQRRASVGHQVQVMSEPAGCYSISMQWSSKSMGNGYSMGLHHHPSLKHLHEFMYIDGEIVNTHIYHLDSFHYPFTSWPIANFGGLSKKITSIPAEARWITSSNVKHVLWICHNPYMI